MLFIFITTQHGLGKNGIYLEDLYVTEAKRGVGAGKKMLKHLANKGT